MVNIYLDPGHGGTDPGASGHGLREKNLTLSIAKHARKYLQDNYEGVKVRMSRTTDKTVSLAQRTNDANKWGADVLVSIHINAGGGIGYEDFIFNGPVSNNTHKLQDAIHKEVSRHFTTNRGQKRANFHMIRESKMSAVLTECGFIDNRSDADFLKNDSNLKKIGEAHAKGIASYLGLKKKKASTTNPASNEGGLYYVQIGAFSKKPNADSLANKARKKGYKYACVKHEGGLYKVQLGAFSDKSNADSQAARAKRAGFNVYVAQ